PRDLRPSEQHGNLPDLMRGDRDLRRERGNEKRTQWRNQRRYGASGIALVQQLHISEAREPTAVADECLWILEQDDLRPLLVDGDGAELHLGAAEKIAAQLGAPRRRGVWRVPIHE